MSPRPLHRRPTGRKRRGATLLEVMVASALSATLIASAFVVVRSSHAAWLAHEQDLDRAASAVATLRHLVQHARQAIGVTSITPSTDSTGAISLVTGNGSTYDWSITSGTVDLSVNGAAAQPISDGVSSLTFEGYQADGVTLTTDPEDVHAVRTIVAVPAPTGGTRQFSSFCWVRSW